MRAGTTSRPSTTCRGYARKKPRRVMLGRHCRRAAISNDLVDILGERDVLVAKPAGIVRRQRNRHLVVDIAPLGVMSGFLGHQRYPRHETERLGKILELELSRDAV